MKNGNKGSEGILRIDPERLNPNTFMYCVMLLSTMGVLGIIFLLYVALTNRIDGVIYGTGVAGITAVIGFWFGLNRKIQKIL